MIWAQHSTHEVLQAGGAVLEWDLRNVVNRAADSNHRKRQVYQRKNFAREGCWHVVSITNSRA
jgi:hypothetical protein